MHASFLFDGEIQEPCPWAVLFETDGCVEKASLRPNERRIDIECGREYQLWCARVSAEERARVDALQLGPLPWFVQGLHRALAGTWKDLEPRAVNRRKRLDARALRALADAWETPWTLEPARMLEAAPLLRELAERRPDDRSAILSRVGGAWIARMRSEGPSRHFLGAFCAARSGPCSPGPMGPGQTQFLRVFSAESPPPPSR